jgi:ribose 5-phosphate isomerase A
MVMTADEAKKAAAAHAAGFVHDGMRLGLGTGSTAAFFVEEVGSLVRSGFKLLCVPTSERTHAQAKALGIPLTTLEETPELDLTVDGADEFDPALRLIKGGGGALLREKIVAAASTRMIVITDESKRVSMLGQFPLPVEVNRFGLEATRRAVVKAVGLAGCAGIISLRKTSEGHDFVTDGGHCILDCALGSIPDPERLMAALNSVPGVVETGLFIGLANAVIVAGASGIEVIGNPG